MSMRKEKEEKKANEKAIVRKFRQFVRIRPFMDEEKNKNTKVEKPEIVNYRSAVEYENGEVRIIDPKSLTPNATTIKTKKKYGGYDGVFWSFGKDPWDAEGREKNAEEKEDIDHVQCDNAGVYDDVKGDSIEMLFDGYNQSVTCYGPMNGGKTYTMNGVDKDPGIAPRMIKDLLDVIPAQKEERQAPGEILEVKVEAQVYRVYKEEIEDLLYGFPRLATKTTDSCKLAANDMDKAFKLDISASTENFNALANRVWTGKECQNKVSKLTTPGKNNRSSTVIILTLTQKSTFEGGDHHGSHQVNAEKISYMTLADVGYGGKSEGENANDFKKISNGQTTYHQLIRKLGEKGAGANTHVPFNTSTLAKLLTVAYNSSHATLICNISPWHKHAAETSSFLEVAEYGAKAKSKAAPGDEADVSEFRENLQKEDNLKKESAAENSKMTRVRDELTSRMHKINELKAALLQAGIETEQWHDRNEQIQQEIAQLQDQFKNQKIDSEMILKSLDDREEKALAKRAAAEAKASELAVEVARLEEEMGKREARITQARDLMTEVQSLKTMLTGRSDLRDPADHNDEPLPEGAIDEEETKLFNDRADESIKDLEVVIAKYKEHVTMSAENTEILKEINTVLHELDEVDGQHSKVYQDFSRAKRRCVREIWKMIDNFFKHGACNTLSDIISRNSGKKDCKSVVDFFQAQYETISRLLGDSLSTDTSPYVIQYVYF